LPTADIPTCSCLTVGRVCRYEGVPHYAKLNVLIYCNKFTVVVERDSFFSLNKVFNIGWTKIIGYQSEPNVIEIFIKLGKVINSNSYIEIRIE
jgi:hypothetical protein